MGGPFEALHDLPGQTENVIRATCPLTRRVPTSPPANYLPYLGKPLQTPEFGRPTADVSPIVYCWLTVLGRTCDGPERCAQPPGNLNWATPSSNNAMARIRCCSHSFDAPMSLMFGVFWPRKQGLSGQARVDRTRRGCCRRC